MRLLLMAADYRASSSELSSAHGELIDIFIPVRLNSTVPFRLCAMPEGGSLESVKPALAPYPYRDREGVLYVKQRGDKLLYWLAQGYRELYSTHPRDTRRGVIDGLERITGISGELTLEQLRPHLAVIYFLIEMQSPDVYFSFPYSNDDILAIYDCLLGRVAGDVPQDLPALLESVKRSPWANNFPTLEPMVGDELNLTATFWERSLAAVDKQLLQNVVVGRSFSEATDFINAGPGGSYAYYALRVRIHPELLLKEQQGVHELAYLPAGAKIEPSNVIAAQRINPRLTGTKCFGTHCLVSSAWPLAEPYLKEVGREHSFSAEFLEQREEYLSQRQQAIQVRCVSSSAEFFERRDEYLSQRQFQNWFVPSSSTDTTDKTVDVSTTIAESSNLQRTQGTSSASKKEGSGWSRFFAAIMPSRGQNNRAGTASTRPDLFLKGPAKKK
jgi:hypothetical protein